MAWKERHCPCPASPSCESERRFQALNFVGHLREGSYDNCKKLLRDVPQLTIRMTWDSVGCAGARGMEVWKRVGYMLQEEPKFSKEPGFKEVALLVIEKSCNGDKAIEAMCKIRFAVSSDHGGSCWADVLQQTIRDGVLPYSDKEKFLQPTSPEFIAIWSQWTEHVRQAPPPSECCICLDKACDSVFYPCAHSDFCFECSKDLTACPLCRTEGYSKPKQL